MLQFCMQTTDRLKVRRLQHGGADAWSARAAAAALKRMYGPEKLGMCQHRGAARSSCCMQAQT